MHIDYNENLGRYLKFKIYKIFEKQYFTYNLFYRIKIELDLDKNYLFLFFANVIKIKNLT